jgi:hypothetical protein
VDAYRQQMQVGELFTMQTKQDQPVMMVDDLSERFAVCPEGQNYCGTYSLFNPMNLVVVEDTNVLEIGIEKVNELLGICTNTAFKQWCSRNNNIARNKLRLQRKTETKRKHVERRAHLFDAERRSNKKAKKDDTDYGACIDAPLTSVYNTPMKGRVLTLVNPNKVVRCKACGGTDHQRKSNMLCPQ